MGPILPVWRHTVVPVYPCYRGEVLFFGRPPQDRGVSFPRVLAKFKNKKVEVKEFCVHADISPGPPHCPNPTCDQKS